MTQPKPKYDLDKAMASAAARSIIQCVLDHKQQTYNFSAAAVQLRAAARVQSVEEADRAYVDSVLGSYATRSESEAKLKACREARAREAAEREGK